MAFKRFSTINGWNFTGSIVMKHYRFVLLVFLCLSLFFNGCYSYFPTTKEALVEDKSQNKVKITLNNNEEVILDSIGIVDFSNPNEIITSQSDSTQMNFSIFDIKEISEERFDFGKTFFATFWITFVASIITFALLFGGHGFQ